MTMPPIALVIDDDASLALLFSDALKTCDFAVKYITRREQAMEKIRATMPDLILLQG